MPATVTTITPGRIKELVEAHNTLTDSMRSRMETDYNVWYRLGWTDSRLLAQQDGYQTYISNEPRTYAKRLIAWISDADLQVRVPLDMKLQAERERANAKEQFIIGCFGLADKALLRRMQLPLRDQLGFFVTVRGMYAGRALLVKLPDGSTTVDITPFDPLNTFWGMGPDGLSWMVHRQVRTVAEIEEEFGSQESLVAQNGHGEGHYVYDWYDRESNGVCTDSEWLKNPEPHYAQRIPCFIGVVGATPLIHGRDTTIVSNSWEHYGESAFDDNREVYEAHNETMSDMKTLVRRSVKPPSVYKSRDGKKVPEDDVYAEGSVLALAGDEDFKTLELLKMSIDTGPFLGQVTGEMQRGSIPHSVYGDLQFQLSGFALNTLHGGVKASVQPRTLAVQNAYSQIADLLCEQYAAGGFQPMKLSGRNMDKTYFSRPIMPGDFDAAQPVEIKLRTNLPQDDMQKFAMAQIAREGPVPALSDRTIRDDILGIQDVDGEELLIQEQMADRASPIAILYGFIESALARGRPDRAEIYGEELQMLLQQRAMQAMGAGGPGPKGQVPPAKPAGMPPEMMPSAMQGVPPPRPTPQAGALVPPGSPRPGARGQPA